MSTFKELQEGFYHEAHGGWQHAFRPLPFYLWNSLIRNLDIEWHHQAFEQALDYMLDAPCSHKWYVDFEPGDGSFMYWCDICGKITVHEPPG